MGFLHGCTQIFVLARVSKEHPCGFLEPSFCIAFFGTWPCSSLALAFLKSLLWAAGQSGLGHRSFCAVLELLQEYSPMSISPARASLSLWRAESRPDGTLSLLPSSVCCGAIAKVRLSQAEQRSQALSCEYPSPCQPSPQAMPREFVEGLLFFPVTSCL